MAEKKKVSKRSNGSAAKKASIADAGTQARDSSNFAYMPSDEEVARKAYALWERRGKPLGSPDEDWYRAKQELSANRV